jgi:hypothetical protein
MHFQINFRRLFVSVIFDVFGSLSYNAAFLNQTSLTIMTDFICIDDVLFTRTFAGLREKAGPLRRLKLYLNSTIEKAIIFPWCFTDHFDDGDLSSHVKVSLIWVLLHSRPI